MKLFGGARCTCEICGHGFADHTRHLVFGTASRRLADEDGLTVRICSGCHSAIHSQAVPGNMSRMMGQLLYEKRILQDALSTLCEGPKEEVREAFRERYGKSYLPEEM